jgi:hypothetical protein
MPESPTLLDALCAKGVLLSVSVRYWRARTRLAAEDLGLQRRQVSDRLIALGHKRLVPREALATLALIESRAHALVEERSFPFLNGVARYLPNDQLAEVNASLAELGREFGLARDAFIADYDRLRQEALAEWTQAATTLGVPAGPLVARIRAALPDAVTLATKFSFSQVLSTQCAGGTAGGTGGPGDAPGPDRGPAASRPGRQERDRAELPGFHPRQRGDAARADGTPGG